MYKLEYGRIHEQLCLPLLPIIVDVMVAADRLVLRLDQPLRLLLEHGDDVVALCRSAAPALMLEDGERI